MLEEACRVKESIFFNDKDVFYLTPSKELQNFEARIFAKNKSLETPVEFSKKELIDLLERKGLYSFLEDSIDRLLLEAEKKGITEESIDDVLMVGGSTLLPEVYSLIEKRFGRDRVRALSPFDAVAYGASAFSAGWLTKSDFITHDYAFITYGKDRKSPKYNIIVPRGTSFPTEKEIWKRKLTPTCAPEDRRKYLN